MCSRKSQVELSLAIIRRLTVARGELLLPYLFDALGLKRKIVKNLLKFGAVEVNGATLRQFDHLLAPGDEVKVNDLSTAVATVRLKSAKIRIVHEDDALIVLDKPSGLLTVATEREKTDTLYARLNDYLRGRGSARPSRALVVHRLDQGTSGLVLFAKSRQVQCLIEDAWQAVEKTYWVVVEGRPHADLGTITSYLTEGKSLKVFSSDHPTPGARLATTHYRLLQTRGDLSLLEVRLESGRKHQIRVHLAGLGCSVAGDPRYGAASDPCHRLALHAGRLALAHPLTGARLKFDSPLPLALSTLFAGSKGCLNPARGQE